MRPAIRDETEPLRDAADFMMDAIADRFGRTGDAPVRTVSPERGPRLLRGLLATLAGLLIAGAIATYAASAYAAFPDYTGANEVQAKTALLDAGFVVTTRTQSSVLVRAQHVIEQAPPAAQWLRKGTAVVLTVSTGLPRVAARRSLPHARPHARPHSRSVPAHTASPPVTPRIARANPPKAASAGHHETRSGNHARHTIARPAAPAAAVTTAVTTNPTPTPCPRRSWLSKTVQHIFAPRSSSC